MIKVKKINNIIKKLIKIKKVLNKNKNKFVNNLFMENADFHKIA